MEAPAGEQYARLGGGKAGNRLPWLSEVGLDDRPEVGGKAAVLGALLAAGLPVPPGFCVPTGIDLRQDFERLAAAYAQLAPEGELVAVRSSGVEEDSQSASFAGQYETVLNVGSPEQLLAAIEQCRRSAASERALAYRFDPGLEAEMAGAGHFAGRAPLPVLVQRQAPAEISGVLFTCNPLTGDPQEMIVEAHPGLGEALVSGRVAPQHYRMDRQGVAHQVPDLGSGGDGLSAEQLQELAALARQVDAVLGPRQDIEWSFAGGQLYVLQARPVTGLRQAETAVSAPAEAWTRANVGEVLPDPVTPLTWGIFRAALQNRPSLAWDATDEAESADAADGVRRINGRVYIRLDALLNSFCYLPHVTPEVMGTVLGVELPQTHHPYRRPEGLPVRLAQLVFRLDALGLLPRLSRLIRRLPPQPARAPHGDRWAEIEALLRWTTELFSVHLKTTAYTIGAFAWAADLLERWRPDRASALLPRLLHGREDLQTAAQGRELWALSRQVQARPAWQAALLAHETWPAVQQAFAALPDGAEFLAALDGFLARHGARAAGEFELAVPRWREAPEFVLAVLRQYAAAAAPLPASGPEWSGDELSDVMPPLQAWLLRRIVDRYSAYSTLRENMKYRLMEGFAALRQAFLKIGVELAQAGVLESAEDIFFLTPAEIRTTAEAATSAASPAGQDVPELRRRIRSRRAERERWMALGAAPELVVGDAPQLGREPAGLAAGGDGSEVLSGVGASPGVVVGTARVLQHISQADRLQPGEILVAPHTDPGWTPLFLSCRAVVTEIGGFLSHGATVAREYRIPCVVNVAGAASRIQTGDRIQVDGTRGQVTLLPKMLR